MARKGRLQMNSDVAPEDCHSPTAAPQGNSGSTFSPLEISASEFERSFPILMTLVLSLFLITSVKWFQWRSTPARRLPLAVEGTAPTFQVDVNRSTWVEWVQLQGIGPALAHRILADREINGDFTSIDDLQRVHGFGPVMLDRIRPWLTISHDPHQSPQHP